jgi:uncharacterized protein (DUF58 family)
LLGFFTIILPTASSSGSGSATGRGGFGDFAAVAAYIITRHGDKVGCLAFPGPALPVVPPRAGRVQALRILQVLSRAGQGEGGLTDLAAALRHAGRMIRRRRLVFLISDFLALPGWEAALRDLSQRHDVIAVWIRDPAEEALPDVGVLPIRDLETGQQAWVDTSDRHVRAAYREMVGTQQARIREAFRRARVDAMELSTAASMVEPLLKFITFRRQRGRWLSARR